MASIAWPTPEELPFDSFNVKEKSMQTPVSSRKLPNGNSHHTETPASPPTSPKKNPREAIQAHCKNVEGTISHSGQRVDTSNIQGRNVADPILYNDELASASSQEDLTLFPDVHGQSRSRETTIMHGIKRKHMHGSTFTQFPFREQRIDQAPKYVSTLSSLSIADKGVQKTWRREQLAENASYYHLARHPPNPNAIIKASSAKQLPTFNARNLSRPIKKTPMPPATSSDAPNKMAHESGIAKPKRKRHSNPKPKEPAKKVVDTNWRAIHDYCPPITLFGNDFKTNVKIVWDKNKDSVLDLSDDPDRHLLLPTEIASASRLRLSCARWLTVKRKMFVKIMECYKSGSNLNKTALQQAGVGMDVNKASSMYVWFEKLGWLERDHFKQWLPKA